MSQELFERYLTRRLSAGESLELSALLEESEDGRAQFVEYVQEWELLAEVSRRAELARHLERGRGAAQAPARARPLASAAWKGLRVAAAAGLLAGVGALALYAVGLLPGMSTSTCIPGEAADERTVVLASGAKVVRSSGAQVEYRGSVDTAEEVIRLVAGEVVIVAPACEPGRTAVRVETDLGVVETLGTEFTVRYERTIRRQSGGGAEMRSSTGRAAALSAALLIVSVTHGRVLVTGGLGQIEVAAGETAEVGRDKAVVGAVDRAIRARVTAVRKGRMGGYHATIAAGRRDGVKVGFEFSCAGKWTGRVTSVAPTSAVLEVEKTVAAGDVASARFSTVLQAGAKPASGAEAAVVKGLRLNLVKDIQVFKRGGGRVGRVQIIAHGGDTKPRSKTMKLPARPPGGTWKRVTLWAELENTSDKPILLPGDDRRMVIVVRAKDDAGKEISMSPTYRQGRRMVNWPETLTVLQPGEKARKGVSVNGLQFGVDGTYKVWVEYEVVEVDAPKGVSCWTGQVKSGSVDWVIDHDAKRGMKRAMKGG